MTLEARFWAKVRKSDGCWEWTGALVRGYGRVNVQSLPSRRKVTALAHRVSYELLVGLIPDGLHLDHLCRNTRCVRPDHLEAVSQQENNRRARKTHCLRGHPFDEANTYRRKDRNERMCRTCHRERQAAYN